MLLTTWLRSKKGSFSSLGLKGAKADVKSPQMVRLQALILSKWIFFLYFLLINVSKKCNVDV